MLQNKYKKSTKSNDHGCIEVAYRGEVLVRDSKNTTPALSFTPSDWVSFLSKFVKEG